jgi:hypothetical protein
LEGLAVGYHFKCALGIFAVAISGAAIAVLGGWLVERVFYNLLNPWFLVLAFPLLIVGFVLLFIDLMCFLVWMDIN